MSLWQDLRFGLRLQGKAPGFAAIAVVTLALGIGANTALFSVVNAVLLDPLPYRQPSRLVAVYASRKPFGHASISYPNFLDWVHDNSSFSSLAAFRSDDFELTGRGEPERVKVEMVSADFFPTLGVAPVMGRQFTAQEDHVGGAPVVLLGGGFWQRKFGGARNVLGKTLTLDDTVYSIVGVMPADFEYASGNFHSHVDVFVPIGQWNDSTFRDRRVGMGMDAVGRLKPGITQAQAQANLDAIAAHLAEEYPNANKGSGVAILPLQQDVVHNVRPFLLVLLAAVAFVLLIACANVANLFLARSTGRTREFAIRAALGASQGRVVRQLLTESLLLSLAGGALGLIVAAWGTHAALGVLPGALPRANEVHLDARVLLFTLAISILAGILFGMAPALKTSRVDLHETLKEGGRGESGARHRTQAVFVAVEMALAVVLLVGAGLMIRSLIELWNVNPGFEPSHVLTFGLSSSQPLGATPDEIRAAFKQIRDQVVSVPGVQAASISEGATPMAGDSELPFWIAGHPKPATESQMNVALFYLVQSDYLRVMKIPLLRGRYLTPEDNEHSAPVVVIDEQFARLYFGRQDPIGQQINLGIIGTSPEIVGIAGHVKQWGLASDARSPIQAQMYIPLSQTPDKFFTLLAHRVGMMVRTQGAPDLAISPIRRKLARFSSELVVYGAQPMSGIIDDSLAAQRFSMILLATFAGLALVLTCVGIYGVVSYVTAQRTHEISIRMALGADRGRVLRMVLWQGSRMALAGVAIGLVAAFGLARLMTKLIFGVTAHDPLTFGAVAGLLFAVALVACYRPAHRATRVDPATALRYE